MTSPTYPKAMLLTINNDQIWDVHILRDSALLSDPTLHTDPALLSYPALLTETALFTDPTDPTLLSYLSLLTDQYPIPLPAPALLSYPTPLDTQSFQQLIGRLIWHLQFAVSMACSRSAAPTAAMVTVINTYHQANAVLLSTSEPPDPP